MFQNLSQKLTGVLKQLQNKGVVREEDLEGALREVRLALLEADVNVMVVRDFLGRVKSKVLGQALPVGVSATDHFLKTVQEELILTLGQDKKNLTFEGDGPHVVLMVGLQGSGKTTSSAKLAHFLKKKGRRPYLLPLDFQRPAAIDQLKVLAKKIDVPVFDSDSKSDVFKTIPQALSEVQSKFCDILIVDTAGRLQVDESLMNDLVKMQKSFVKPKILFVADAMTGQDAVNVAKAFHEALTIEGVILTKMDGDAKGGAALSVQSVAGCPLYFMGTGEKIDEFEVFYPDRLVSRLLDRGDLLSLIEKATEAVSPDEAMAMADKFKKNDFDLNDFLTQLKQMKKMGSMAGLMKFIPGMGQMASKIDVNAAEKELKRKEAIVQSMTNQERRQPDLLNGSRRMRIAKGSGTEVSEINRFMKEFEQMQKMMKMLNKGGMGAMQKMMGGFGRS